MQRRTRHFAMLDCILEKEASTRPAHLFSRVSERCIINVAMNHSPYDTLLRYKKSHVQLGFQVDVGFVQAAVGCGVFDDLDNLTHFCVYDVDRCISRIFQQLDDVF